MTSVEERIERAKPLRDAAALLRQGIELTPVVAHAVADLLDSEAVVIGEMEPFLELLNATISHATGTETFLRFGKKENGAPAMHGDTSQAAFALAAHVLALREDW